MNYRNSLRLVYFYGFLILTAACGKLTQISQSNTSNGNNLSNANKTTVSDTVTASGDARAEVVKAFQAMLASARHGRPERRRVPNDF